VFDDTTQEADPRSSGDVRRQLRLHSMRKPP
jgi:hypothetical protein